VLDVETKKQTEFSPGPVEDQEQLLRAVFVPDHVDENGELKPEAIPRTDLQQRGFSVYRHGYVSRERFDGVLEGYLQKDKNRACTGIAKLICGAVRSISDEEERQAFLVFDDANVEIDEAHAAILFSSSYTPSRQKRLRKILLGCLNKLYSKDEIFDK